MRRKEAWCRNFSLGIGRQAKQSKDSLEIVVAIEFDLNPAALLSMMNYDTGGEVLLQAIFQIAQVSRTESFSPSSTSRAATLAEPARHHPLRRAHG
jgi:hypothetical protein